jgi:hypothetical protein
MKPSTALSGARPSRKAVSAAAQISQGVIEERRAGAHGVLIIAEARQGFVDEFIQRAQRIAPRHRPVEGFDVAEAFWKSCGDQRHNFACDRVGRKAQPFRRNGARRQGLAIVRIEIPLAACWGVAVHQNMIFDAQFAIEKLHAQLAPRAGPFPKSGLRGEEAIIVANFQRNRGSAPPGLKRLTHPPFARLGDDDFFGTMPGDGAG